MKVAAIQMPTVKDKIQNIRTAGTYIEKIKAENPDFVILPEMFCCPYQAENFPIYAEKEGGPSWQAMSDYARKYHKLAEWHTFCDWVCELPYFTDLFPFINVEE